MAGRDNQEETLAGRSGSRGAGPWGVFPFFGSGKVIASDGFNGLIVARLSE